MDPNPPVHVITMRKNLRKKKNKKRKEASFNMLPFCIKLSWVNPPCCHLKLNASSSVHYHK